ncbi:MAG: hypothetical protein KF833_17565 [Verrucomicrobiae bacterium]|nr:hypothetical protein [Verrucomicrobiae bacterium]
MPLDRVLITVKTYPTLSRKYGETVCTAGVRKDGSWVRIYPVPFRRLDQEEQYSKFDWIEADLRRSTSDPRPETMHPTDVRQLQPVGHIDTRDNWRERRKLILETARVYSRLDDLIAGARANQLSLAVFRPKRIMDFVWEEEEREWDREKLAQMRDRTRQGELFTEDAWRQTFQVIPKLPYSFSYRLEDSGGRRSELQVLDWETGALYWRCLRSTNGDEAAALAKVRAKYLGEFGTRDLHLFLGTTQEFHFRAPNPWVIVGVFQIPHQRQCQLL